MTHCRSSSDQISRLSLSQRRNRCRNLCGRWCVYAVIVSRALSPRQWTPRRLPRARHRLALTVHHFLCPFVIRNYNYDIFVRLWLGNWTAQADFSRTTGIFLPTPTLLMTFIYWIISPNVTYGATETRSFR